MPLSRDFILTTTSIQIPPSRFPGQPCARGPGWGSYNNLFTLLATPFEEWFDKVANSRGCPRIWLADRKLNETYASVLASLVYWVAVVSCGQFWKPQTGLLSD